MPTEYRGRNGGTTGRWMGLGDRCSFISLQSIRRRDYFQFRSFPQRYYRGIQCLACERSIGWFPSNRILSNGRFVNIYLHFYSSSRQTREIYYGLIGRLKIYCIDSLFLIELHCNIIRSWSTSFINTTIYVRHRSL